MNRHLVISRLWRTNFRTDKLNSFLRVRIYKKKCIKTRVKIFFKKYLLCYLFTIVPVRNKEFTQVTYDERRLPEEIAS